MAKIPRLHRGDPCSTHGRSISKLGKETFSNFIKSLNIFN
jgi:hypothetical protein